MGDRQTERVQGKEKKKKERESIPERVINQEAGQREETLARACRRGHARKGDGVDRVARDRIVAFQIRLGQNFSIRREKGRNYVAAYFLPKSK